MEQNKNFLTLCAPLQGFTEAPFRHFHLKIYNADNQGIAYITPFLRIENGTIRPKDFRELTSPLNRNHSLTPQIIFRDEEEFTRLVDIVMEAGYKDVDLNLGCPFTPQVKKGRGAGLLSHPSVLSRIERLMNESYGLSYSIKMRLGIRNHKEWCEIADILNSMPLSHLTLHPRVALQQYGGSPYLDEFAEFTQRIKHPVIYNGDITLPSQIDDIIARFPTIAGVMIGRGLLMRPSLINEWREGSEWPAEKRNAHIFRLHDEILNHLTSTLTGGETQILTKIKPFWEYFGAGFDRKAVKKIVKAANLANYRTAVGLLSRE